MKGFKYFFNLLGRNIKGNFDYWFSPEKIKARPLVWVPALIIGIPLTVISPVTAFFKTAIDYVTRTSLPNLQESRLKIPGRSLADRLLKLKDMNEINSVAGHAVNYQPKSKYFTSKSTAKMMSSLAQVVEEKSAGSPLPLDTSATSAPAKTPAQEAADGRVTIMAAYAADPKNANKGMFKRLAAKVLELTPEPEQETNTLRG